MHLKDEAFQLINHVAMELLKFPNENLSRKQVQQFLGIVNYLKDFVPKISKLLHPLQKIFKKEALPWGKAQTKAIKTLKVKLQDLPPL